LLSRALAGRPAVRLASSLSACAVLTVLAWAGYAQAMTPHKMQYREIAKYLSERVSPSEFIYIPEMSALWGIARYLTGPDWGNLLRVQDPLDVNRLDSWRRIYAKLGPDRLRMLHLIPETRRLDGFKAPIITGWTSFPELAAAPSYWVITSTGVDLAELNLCSPRETQALPFGRQVDLSNYIGLMAYYVHCTAAARGDL